MTANRGRRNGNAVLHEAEVRLIRARLDAGETIGAVAQDYCVSGETIARIKTRKTWAWLDLVESDLTPEREALILAQPASAEERMKIEASQRRLRELLGQSEVDALAQGLLPTKKESP